MTVYEQLVSATSFERVLQSEPMERHTTIRIGGPCDYYIQTQSIEEVVNLLELCKRNHLPYFVLGNGSNLLVSDEGFRGLVLRLPEPTEPVVLEKERDGRMVVKVAGGCRLSKCAMAVAECGLTGLEFAAGIPGTLGGAVVMNAGAYGGEIKDTIISAEVLRENGELITLSKEQLSLGYRTSAIQGTSQIVVSASFHLRYGEKEDILARIQEMNRMRREKQPLEFPSAGSAFKRPQGMFAGKLIMDSGLAGYRVRDAQVSEKHCGFVINRGNATADDVKQLLNDVIARVEDKFGVRLEPEIQYLDDRGLKV